ncbi:MAG TPA: rRNA pseudouridine synthase [Candidatus Copromonas faecavium]|uniref:Pseudouridine synthase n=1 Tax=Candidatus Copromonas faecavium (nom. illeg.) TaxID=2840740 RepID=A0A9D1D436_9FIRM|nr:rRNA pseudouridine synthase [Candidatus Copromonas faecavium]
MRLDRFLAEMNQGSRSELKEWIRRGRVLVNGQPETRPERKILTETDEVFLDGRRIFYTDLEYYMLHKPAGVLSAAEDKKRSTVLDLIEEKKRKDLFPVGRLDLNTEGLLLITNDGGLAHRLLSPKSHVDKVYYALCAGQLPEDAKDRLQKGLVLPDGLACLPAKLVRLTKEDRGGFGDLIEWETIKDRVRMQRKEPGELLFSEEEQMEEVLLTIREGKFHQVKRMMEAVGCPVLYLKRLSMGTLRLDASLKPGEYRPLDTEELELLRTW